jgi:hypothetical protein
MRSHQIEAQICVRGRPIKEYSDPSGNVWIEAREGSAYSIRVKNNEWWRKLVVVSVDGINVITGRPAEEKPEDGYVVSGFNSLNVEGWRTGNDSVKEFLFTFDKKKSYSVRLGEGKANLGVIGILVWSERQYPITYSNSDSYYTMPNATPYNGDPLPWQTPIITCSAHDKMKDVRVRHCDTSYSVQTTSLDFQAGTAKGKEIDSQVTETSFFADRLEHRLTYYYDSYRNLVERGVIRQEKQKLPQPFKPSRYCPDI